MKKEALLIFVRNPEAGKVKTRLAATVGAENALKIYRLLLEHTRKITLSLSCDKFVYYSEAVEERDMWDNAYQKKVQQGNTLGERMHHAFATAFADGYYKVMMIGSDNYELKTTHIEKAFQALETHDMAIGPARDGGYYLLGMKTLHPAVFKGKKWSTSTVLADTLEEVKEKKVQLLETLNDIDTYEDIRTVKAFQPFLKPEI